MRDAVLILVTAVLSFVALRRPVVGMLAFIGYGLMAPHTLTWSVARTMPHSLLLAASTIAGYVFSRGPKQIPLERETVLLLLLWSLFGMSTVFAIEQDAAFQRWILVTKILFMVLLSTSLIKDEELLHQMFRVIGLALGFYALKGGLWFVRTGGAGTVEAPEGSFLSANNSLGVALVMNMPILYFLARAEDRLWLRRVFELLFWLSYPAVIGTYSRGAWVGAAAVSTLLFFNIRHKFLVIVSGVALFMIAVPFVAGMVSERLVQRASTLQGIEQENSAQQRLDSWAYCFRVGWENPVFGGGFDFYSQATIDKYNPKMLERWTGKVWSCHSSWFTVWSEHGIAAFGLWLMLIVSTFVSLKSIKRKLWKISSSAPSKLRYWPPMIEISMVGYVVSASFVDFAYFDLFYQLIAATVMMRFILKQAPSTETYEGNETGDPSPIQRQAVLNQAPT